MNVGDVGWARVTVERRPEGGTSWQVGGWARDDQLLPDGPLLRWLSGEDEMPNPDLVSSVERVICGDSFYEDALRVMEVMQREAGRDALG